MAKRAVVRSSAPRLIVGLMSGTSIDGIDAALVEVRGPAERPRVRLRAFVNRPYPRAVRRRLLALAAGEPTNSGEVSDLNFRVGELFAAAALKACRAARVPPQALAAIGSHGQTVFHQGSPATGRRASTLQIGEPAVIAERTGAPVIADFRAADVAAGGQGAPLVPLVDYLLLSSRQEGRATLNLGGIANVTVLARGGSCREVFGFDTGPGNMILDALVRHFTRGEQTYDRNGRWAAQGVVIEPLLREALRDPFLRRRPPKSAGREQFGAEFVARHFLRHRRAAPCDLLRTAVELTACSVAQALARFVFARFAIHRLIVSGGGVHHPVLMSRLRALVPGLAVVTSDGLGVPADAKEAIAFAVLADRTLHGLPGNLPSVTGAGRAVVLGTVAWPDDQP